MLKTKQSDLKKIISDQKWTMALKCAECFGFYVDGYEKCTSKTCPLLPFYPSSSYISQGSFVEAMKQKAKELDNDISFIQKITGKQENLYNSSKRPDRG